MSASDAHGSADSSPIPAIRLPYGEAVTPAAVTQMALETMREIGKSIDAALVGRFVRVKSDHNGQPYGRSRKSWKGEVCKIMSVHIDLHDGICLCLEGHEYECFIDANEVEFA